MTRTTLQTDSVTLHVAAAPEHLYDLVADVTRMGEWSPECLRCEWLSGATHAHVGARFKAHNRRGRLRWSNTPTVVVAQRGREFAFSRTSFGAGEYTWRYRIAPAAGGGSDITESYEAVRPESRIVSLVVNRLFTPGTEADHLRNSMTTTLGRIKQVAEQDRNVTPGRP